jgi:hypothetical protein
MSFGKLLAAGKSFAGGQSMERYRVNSRAILPKFISHKNPFAQLPNKEASARPVIPVTTAQCLPEQAADAGARAASSNDCAKSAARASVWSRAGLWLAGCARKWNPLKLFKRRVAQPKSVIPQFGKETVKGELSLERVRVVRNDLSDADLEVVPAGAAGGANKQSRTDGAWGRLAARIFDAETT